MKIQNFGIYFFYFYWSNLVYIILFNLIMTYYIVIYVYFFSLWYQRKARGKIYVYLYVYIRILYTIWLLWYYIVLRVIYYTRLLWKLTFVLFILTISKTKCSTFNKFKSLNICNVLLWANMLVKQDLPRRRLTGIHMYIYITLYYILFSKT